MGGGQSSVSVDGPAGVRRTFGRNPAVLGCESPEARAFAEDLVMGVTGALEQIDGVLNVHDLRIWTITSGIHSLSCHLLVEERADNQTVLQRANAHIRGDFGIRYATVQIETQNPVLGRNGQICTMG